MLVELLQLSRIKRCQVLFVLLLLLVDRPTPLHYSFQWAGPSSAVLLLYHVV
jgi:hypothetical protein